MSNSRVSRSIVTDLSTVRSPFSEVVVVSEAFDVEDLEDMRRFIEDREASLEPLGPKSGIERFAESKVDTTEKTRDEYRRKLCFFEEYCEINEIENLNGLSGRDIDGYRHWRREESSNQVDTLSPKTMRDEMYLLGDFIGYLESIEAVKDDLSEKIVVPDVSTEDEVRDVELPPERANRILEYLEKYQYASREHIVWLLHCETGRRPGGIRSLDLDDYRPDGDDSYLKFRHRPGETRLKNGRKGEEDVTISGSVCEVLDDYIEGTREETTSDSGRHPLLTSIHGRLSISAMRKYIYKWSRPCEIAGECPHDRDISSCEARETSDSSSKCPSSCASYAIRHGYITELRRQKIPKEVISDRCDVSEEILKKHYDERSIEERRELRRDILSEVGGGYLDG